METEIKELYAYKDNPSTYQLTVFLIPSGGGPPCQVCYQAPLTTVTIRQTTTKPTNLKCLVYIS